MHSCVKKFLTVLTKTLLLSAGPLFFLGSNAIADAIPVSLEKTDQGWRLIRADEPYFIKGAGGDHALTSLAAAGANSIRTWDAQTDSDNNETLLLLDQAHALGLSVTLGIWLGHERHGFDYNDAAQVAEQLERVRKTVLRYKDHPALLIWGLGNEMEGFEAGDNPVIWNAVNDIATMVKELDPHHPTMTVTAFVHGERIRYVHERMPAIDIHGVNAYGGAVSVHQRLREAGASKPFVLTEFGPLGPWESNKTDWGAPYEQTSTEKADYYRRSYQEGVQMQRDLALGSYAFVWGHKMEATPTWFGMWLQDGSRLGVVDTMTELWSGGRKLKDQSPKIEEFRAKTDVSLDPGGVLEVLAKPIDPEGTPLTARWALRPDSNDVQTGGDFRATPPVVTGAIISSSPSQGRVRMPKQPGPYRIYYTVFDEAGNAATANLPVLVKGKRQTYFPLAVYDDSFEGMPWAPSGWMGGTEHLSVDGSASRFVHSGKHSIRIRYEGVYNWAGVAWQNPSNNWGDLDGGFDLTGATALELWARGQYGGEKVSFGVGLLDAARSYPDSAITEIRDIVLTREWQRFEIPLNNLDLSSIKTGFVVTLLGRQTPVTVYLDSIRYLP